MSYTAITAVAVIIFKTETGSCQGVEKMGLLRGGQRSKRNDNLSLLNIISDKVSVRSSLKQSSQITEQDPLIKLAV